jgi:ribosomal protein L29
MKKNTPVFLLITLSFAINLTASSALPQHDFDTKLNAEHMPAYSIEQLQQKLVELEKEKGALSFQYGMAHNAKVSKAFAVNANACKLLTLKSLANSKLDLDIAIHRERTISKQKELEQELRAVSEEYAAHRKLYVNLQLRISLINEYLAVLAKPPTKKMPPLSRRHSYPK